MNQTSELPKSFLIFYSVIEGWFMMILFNKETW